MPRNFKKILSIALPLFLFAVILSYTYYKTRDLLRGVVLNINGVANGEVFRDPTVKISGSAKNALKLSVNGREIFIDKNANFAEQLLLLPGFNILTVKAEDKFGYINEKNYKLIFEQ